ncbi:unnamed protein product [Blepharisma stoltei]|uniref:Importin subunit alpha n=1 Tax=Blepharisma stoltei TaxID=1481888 RepID=A0AAU9JQX9_9CILI|nr:unnamed protein product [Blepharisma stoltei]
MEQNFGFAQNPSSSFFCFRETNNPAHISDNNNPSDTSRNEISSSTSQMSLPNTHSNSIEESSILEAIDKINSDDQKLQYEGLQLLRKEVSRENNSPINLIIRSGICERILDLASTKSDDKFIFEAVWTLSKILSGTFEQASYLMHLNVIPFLFTLFDKNNEDLKEQLMRGFGNIAADNSTWRNWIINYEMFSCIIELCNNVNFNNTNLIKTYCWAVSNFIQGNPPPKTEKVLPFASFLYKVIIEVQDQETLIEASLGCSYPTELDPSIEIFQKELFLKKIIKQLSSRKTLLLKASLKILKNIGEEMDNAFSILFKLGFFKKTEGLLCHQKKSIRREICCTLADLTSECEEIISIFFENKIYEKLLSIIKADCEDVKKQALFVIYESACVCDENQIMKLAQIGIIKELISCIKWKKWRPIILEALSLFIEKVPIIL